MTLVEMLTAIGIIALLISMLVLGINFVTAKAKTDKTRTMLQNLRSMQEEFIAKGGRLRMIDESYLSTGSWQVIQREVAPVGQLIEGNPLRHPQPNGSNPALTRTKTVMGALVSIPDNRKIIDNLPPEAFLMAPVPTGSAAGTKENAYKPPILLDGWGNPIIYAPRRVAPVPNPSSPPSGITGKPEDKDLVWGIEGLTVNGEPNHVFQPADGKGLWVSAGPDGDFSTGDDNVYSDDSGRQSTGKKQ
jgi:type II secretory pathway pseudopilin PulG